MAGKKFIGTASGLHRTWRAPSATLSATGTPEANGRYGYARNLGQIVTVQRREPADRFATIGYNAATRGLAKVEEHIMDGDAALIAAAAVKPACLWWDTEFEPRKGGSPQRFCDPKHGA